MGSVDLETIKESCGLEMVQVNLMASRVWRSVTGGMTCGKRLKLAQGMGIR